MNLQPASGLMLAHLTGTSLTEPWLMAAYGLYAPALACWTPVVWLQIKAQPLARQAADSGAPPGAEYRRTMRLCSG